MVSVTIFWSVGLRWGVLCKKEKKKNDDVVSEQREKQRQNSWALSLVLDTTVGKTGHTTPRACFFHCKWGCWEDELKQCMPGDCCINSQHIMCYQHVVSMGTISGSNTKGFNRVKSNPCLLHPFLPCHRLISPLAIQRFSNAYCVDRKACIFPLPLPQIKMLKS